MGRTPVDSMNGFPPATARAAHGARTEASQCTISTFLNGCIHAWSAMAGYYGLWCAAAVGP
jgi:hypothetical protein